MSQASITFRFDALSVSTSRKPVSIYRTTGTRSYDNRRTRVKTGVTKQVIDRCEKKTGTWILRHTRVIKSRGLKNDTTR